MVSEFIMPDTLGGYGLFAQSHIYANTFELVAGKIVILDDFYLLLVPPETRVAKTYVEPRNLLVTSETGLITTLIEPREIQVEPETGIYLIAAAKATQVGNRTRRIEQ